MKEILLDIKPENNAREVIEEYFNAYLGTNVDHFLMWLYAEGYKVVPHDTKR